MASISTAQSFSSDDADLSQLAAPNIGRLRKLQLIEDAIEVSGGISSDAKFELEKQIDRLQAVSLPEPGWRILIDVLTSSTLERGETKQLCQSLSKIVRIRPRMELWETLRQNTLYAISHAESPTGFLKTFCHFFSELHQTDSKPQFSVYEVLSATTRKKGESIVGFTRSIGEPLSLERKGLLHKDNPEVLDSIIRRYAKCELGEREVTEALSTRLLTKLGVESSLAENPTIQKAVRVTLDQDRSLIGLGLTLAELQNELSRSQNYSGGASAQDYLIEATSVLESDGDLIGFTQNYRRVSALSRLRKNPGELLTPVKECIEILASEGLNTAASYQLVATTLSAQASSEKSYQLGQLLPNLALAGITRGSRAKAVLDGILAIPNYTKDGEIVDTPAICESWLRSPITLPGPIGQVLIYAQFVILGRTPKERAFLGEIIDQGQKAPELLSDCFSSLMELPERDWCIAEELFRRVGSDLSAFSERCQALLTYDYELTGQEEAPLIAAAILAGVRSDTLQRMPKLRKLAVENSLTVGYCVDILQYVSDIDEDSIPEEVRELKPDIYANLTRMLDDACERIGNLPSESGFLIRKLRNFLYHGDDIYPAEIPKFTNEIMYDASVEILVRGVNSSQFSTARSWLDSARSDSLPYALQIVGGEIANPEAKRALAQTKQVYRRAYDEHYGFGSLTYEAQRLPSKEPPLISQYATELARSQWVINCSDIHAFPGKGYMFERLDPKKIFVHDEGARRQGRDPLHRYKEAWGYLSEAIDDLSMARFVFTRGFMALSVPDPKRYGFLDRPYSYLVFNEHFRGQTTGIALLLPTDLLFAEIGSAAIPLKDYKGFDHSRFDISRGDFSPEHFREVCSRRDTPLVNLGWGSNLGGGLSNAFTPRSAPYHSWEGTLRGHTTDHWGHVHKSHINGQYESTMSTRLDKALQPLREAHDLVYTVATRYQNMVDLEKLVRALWHRGETLLGKPKSDQLDTDLSNSQLDLKDWDPSDLRLNSASTRMLAEAYKWHKSGRRHGLPPERYPVLCLADSLRYSKKPIGPRIDTYDMTLTVDGEKILLPKNSDGKGERESTLWELHIAPLLNSSVDLRFYHRDELK